MYNRSIDKPFHTLDQEFYYILINNPIIRAIINNVLLESLHYAKSLLPEFLAEAFRCHVHHYQCGQGEIFSSLNLFLTGMFQPGRLICI